MIKIVYSVVSCLLILCADNLIAQSITVSPVFGSGMVIQQRDTITLNGKAQPGKTVSVSVSWSKGKYKSASGADGKWSVKFVTPAASCSPETITVRCGKDRLVLNDVLVGDVWLVGGQSNMEMNFNGNPDQPVNRAQEILMSSSNSNIRILRVKNRYSLTPSDTLETDGWQISSPESIRNFSVIGYVFGSRIQKMENIPVGLIQSAHGGSVAEAWIDRETLQEFGEFDIDASLAEIDPVWYAMEPVLLYNKMIHPMLPVSVKGVIWYQGESNVNRPNQYKRLFPLLVKSWRRYFRKDNLPFFYVQIAPYDYPDCENSAIFREVQLGLMHEIENTGMAVTMDVGEKDIIHPAEKETVGNRLAYWALNKVYGHTALHCNGPELKAMTVNGNKVVLKFDYADNGLSFFGNEPSGFEIAGRDKVFYPAKARIVPSFWGNDGLEIWSESVLEPVAVRYCYKDYVKGTLYNTDGLPASSFRTDNW